MRDPARIDRILGAIRARWQSAPDLRLGQLLINAVPRFEDAGYHVEDDEIEAAFAPTTQELVDCESCQQTLSEGTTCIDCDAHLTVTRRDAIANEAT